MVPGEVSGELLVGRAPISFWGGYDPATGTIIDRRHPLAGTVASGRILAIPGTRGSSTTTAILLEAIRAGTAPAAIVTAGVDGFVALAAIVAEELFDRTIAVVALEPTAFAALPDCGRAHVSSDGTIDLT